MVLNKAICEQFGIDFQSCYNWFMFILGLVTPKKRSWDTIQPPETSPILDVKRPRPVANFYSRLNEFGVDQPKDIKVLDQLNQETIEDNSGHDLPNSEGSCYERGLISS